VIPAASNPSLAQRGFVMVTSLLLLVVVTIIAISMFRSFGIQEKITGNMREKHRALHAAESAQQYAEWWLTSGENINQVFNCNALQNANLNQGQVCLNSLPTVVADVTAVPWQIAGADVGVDYTPPTMNVTATSAVGTYFQTPRFYISLLGASASGQGTVYQIDAVGYGGTANAVAVVESTYLVAAGVRDLGAP
jgi:type IV pilus assembly protein PilX